MNFEQFCLIINDLLPKPMEILPEHSLLNDLGLCSFDMMVLIVQIEEISEKNIDVSSMRNNMTVQELFTLINR